jgi:hypothetical protein
VALNFGDPQPVGSCGLKSHPTRVVSDADTGNAIVILARRRLTRSERPAARISRSTRMREFILRYR